MTIDIDVIGHSIKLKDHKKGYKNALIANNIPKQFNQLLKFFNAPTFNDNLSIKKLIYTKQTLKCVEYMLWNWKSNLAIEWYPFIMGLKHDILLAQGELAKDRIIKTQTNPMAILILDN